MGDSDSSKLGVVYSRFLPFLKKKKKRKAEWKLLVARDFDIFKRRRSKKQFFCFGRVVLHLINAADFSFSTFLFFIWKSNNKGNKSWTNKSWREETGDGSLLASKLPFVVHRDVDSLVVLFHLLKEKRTLLANNYPMLQSLCIVSFR